MVAARIIQNAAWKSAHRQIAAILACWLLIFLVSAAVSEAPVNSAIPPPAVEIAGQDGGGFLITAPGYRARINPDGNLHSLQVYGVEFLDDTVTGSAGASFFTDRSVSLPTMRLDGRKIVATNGNFTIRYEFNESFITLVLMHDNPQGAAFIAVCSRQINYVENLAQAGTAAAPAAYDWPDVIVTVPTGEYLELRGGSRIWGRDLGRQVWECSNLAPDKQYTIMMIMGQKPPRTPDLSQLTTLTAAINHADALVPAGQPVELQVRFENSSNQPVTSELTARVESYLGKVLLDERKPLACPPRQSVTLSWALAPAEPDFYTADWTVSLDGTPKKQSLTFGYDVEALAPPVQAPPDFTDYWNRVVTEANAAEVKLTRLEEDKRSTGTVTVYRIAVEAEGFNCFGWLSVPKFPGKYPGLLLLPGDRVRYISPNAALADCGFVVMTIEPTGQPINGRLEPLIAQGSVNLNDSTRFGLRPVMIRYLRAMTALASVPEVDANRLAVSGIGLGGGLALILGAVDERIQAIAPDVPYYCHIELNRSKENWPYREVAAHLRRHPEQEAAVLQTLRYFDAANFAPLITCPVLTSAGINDAYSHPTTIFGVHNRLAGPKAINLYPGGHEGGGIRHWEVKIRWLSQVLGRPTPVSTVSDGAGAP
jgi:cephalosporin-C deacetylase-like acetyl esterase